MLLNKILKNLLLITSLGFFSCESPDYLLKKVSSQVTGIDFENKIEDDEAVSILDYMYFYNGGGVAVGDINNDGLDDIYLISNRFENKLYVNKGGLSFEDITKSAKVEGQSDWQTGATMVDINNDGWLDIYVCAVTGIHGFKGYNELYINQKDGTFKEQAMAYGLAYQNYSVSAAFFDYDKDGDLDVYLLNHGLHNTASYSNFERKDNSNEMSSDKLLRNDSGKFVDVSKLVGLKNQSASYGLAVSVADLNNDGWDDLYISNDFFEDDYLYINQQDGTFIEEAKSYLSNTSQFSMGNDIADLNHDSFPEIISLDMLPENEKTLKEATGNSTVNILNQKRRLGYMDQFPRNHLQLNTGKDKFLEIAQFSGVSATDWSWSALFSDFDLDGYQDLFISNGILRRPNDADYIKYVSSDEIRTKLELTKLLDQDALKKMPSGKVPNALFRGSQTLEFKNQSSTWMDPEPTLSNGTAFADFDQDGDLDLIINNVNNPATLLENKATEKGNNYCVIEFKGPPNNLYGLGTKAYVYSQGKVHYRQLHTTRGYQSSMPPKLYFGLGKGMIDSLKIVWPNDKTQQYYALATNQKYSFDYKDSQVPEIKKIKTISPFFNKTNDLGIEVTFKDNYFPQFNREKLMPYGITDEGPALAIGDINNDKKMDLYIGGVKMEAGNLYISSDNGYIKQDSLLFEEDRKFEDVDALFTDYDADGDLDLFVVSGGGEYTGNSSQLKDRIYNNDGTGHFSKTEGVLPSYQHTGSVVKQADIDDDGDLDYFVGSRAINGDFGLRPTSYLLINKGNRLSMTQTSTLSSLGMVTDAAFIDYDKDGDSDLWVVAEWDYPRLFQNTAGTFTEVTQSVLKNLPKGLWQSTLPFDIDADGDMDLVVGNVGLNTKFKADENYPLKMYRSDFDQNGQAETILAMAKEGVYYPIDNKDKLQEQLQSFIRKRFNSYSAFAGTALEEVMGKEALANAELSTIDELKSGYFEKTDQGYIFKAFPTNFQWGPLHLLSQINIGEIPHLILAGTKTDLPPYQGVWKSQPPLLLSTINEPVKDLADLGISLYQQDLRKMVSLQIDHKEYLLTIVHNNPVEVYLIPHIKNE